MCSDQIHNVTKVFDNGTPYLWRFCDYRENLDIVKLVVTKYWIVSEACSTEEVKQGLMNITV